MSNIRTSVSASPMHCYFSEWDPRLANRCRTTLPLARSSLRPFRLFHGMGASISSPDTPWRLISGQTCGCFSFHQSTSCGVGAYVSPTQFPSRKSNSCKAAAWSIINRVPLAHHAVQPAMMRVGDVTPLSPSIDFESTVHQQRERDYKFHAFQSQEGVVPGALVENNTPRNHFHLHRPQMRHF